ncbi:MAG: zinc ribbon domain-containing protein [Chloroflexota bacterium]
MELGSLLLVLATLIAVGLYLAQPYLNSRPRRIAAEAHEISALLAERDRVVNALQELDFDHNLDKIPAEEYPAQRTALLQKGAEILKRLDEMTASEMEEPAEDRVEQAVAARRADLAARAEQKPLDDDDLESLIASRRSARKKEKSGGFCPRCGKPVLASDRFCPNCGKSLS